MVLKPRAYFNARVQTEKNVAHRELGINDARNKMMVMLMARENDATKHRYVS